MTLASPRTGVVFEQVEYSQPLNNNTSLSGNNAVPPSLEPQTTPTASPLPEPTMLDLHRRRRLVESHRFVATTGTFCNRLAVVSVGFFLGWITLLPNLMMSDSGTSSAITAARVGLVASGSMIVGGVIGAVRGTPWAGWFWILPGVVLEILLVATLAISWRAGR
jgi:hypothetical protein